MNATTETAVEDRPDDHFGLCPKCHKTDGYFNIGREHYYHCKQHRTVWHVGSNLFSSWRDETDEDWQKNRTDFAAYRAAEPYFYPRPTSSEPDPAPFRKAACDDPRLIKNIVDVCHRIGVFAIQPDAPQERPSWEALMTASDCLAIFLRERLDSLEGKDEISF